MQNPFFLSYLLEVLSYNHKFKKKIQYNFVRFQRKEKKTNYYRKKLNINILFLTLN